MKIKKVVGCECRWAVRGPLNYRSLEVKDSTFSFGSEHTKQQGYTAVAVQTSKEVFLQYYILVFEALDAEKS